MPMVPDAMMARVQRGLGAFGSGPPWCRNVRTAMVTSVHWISRPVCLRWKAARTSSAQGRDQRADRRRHSPGSWWSTRHPGLRALPHSEVCSASPSQLMPAVLQKPSMSSASSSWSCDVLQRQIIGHGLSSSRKVSPTSSVCRYATTCAPLRSTNWSMALRWILDPWRIHR